MGARPLAKTSTREQLLAAGRGIVLARGMPALTVRNVAAAAGANPGSFVYHFGTRDAFLRALIEEWYAPVFKRVANAADGEGAAIDRLRHAIVQLVDYGIAHNAFIGRIVMAAAAGEPAAREFLASLAGRHPRLLLGLIVAAQADGALVDAPPLQIMCFMVASVALPLLLASAWQGPPLFGKTLSASLGRVARDRDRILQRLDWSLRGLKPGVI